MANKPIDMKKLRAALRLHKNGHGKRSIAKTCGISKATVKKYINLFNALGIEWKQIKQMDDKALFDLFTRTTKDTTRYPSGELHLVCVTSSPYHSGKRQWKRRGTKLMECML
ncbi:MAG: hypothetical protein DRI69_06205 [Bacteroidetes bacterium]|nr:MAG: hypothetical protein DRI69_06205 [Bacteroidota bacterium]